MLAVTAPVTAWNTTFSLTAIRQCFKAVTAHPARIMRLDGYTSRLAAMPTSRCCVDLVTLRASQHNGCAFCVGMHLKEATIHGERALRLRHAAEWCESTLFSPHERAVLAWTEVLTQLPAHGVPDADLQAAREHLSEVELAELCFVIVGINGWNRLSVGFATVPGSLDKAYGLDKANLV